MSKPKGYPFHSIQEEAENKELGKRIPQTPVPAYELAFMDQEFLLSRQLRSVRLELEYLKADLKQLEENIQSTIVIFGSSRMSSTEDAEKELIEAESYVNEYPNEPEGLNDLSKAKKNLEKTHYYEQARKLGHIISTSEQAKKEGNFVVCTGGGPGIMEAANRGAIEADGQSIGLSIYLPTEESANPYISPELHFQFHYFAIRKMHFLNRARALVYFPGGYGTLDELFEALTLMQTLKIKRIPVLLFGEKYWRKLVNFEFMVEENAIAKEDLKYFEYVETAEEAWQKIKDFYQITPHNSNNA